MINSSEDYELSTLVFYRENHGKQFYYSWEAYIWWSETPGKPREKLFSIIGMNATKVLLKTDPEYGEVDIDSTGKLGYFVTQKLKKSCITGSQEKIVKKYQ